MSEPKQTLRTLIEKYSQKNQNQLTPKQVKIIAEILAPIFIQRLEAKGILLPLKKKPTLH